jgi:hypothetical protein
VASVIISCIPTIPSTSWQSRWIYRNRNSGRLFLLDRRDFNQVWCWGCFRIVANYLYFPQNHPWDKMVWEYLVCFDAYFSFLSPTSNISTTRTWYAGQNWKSWMRCNNQIQRIHWKIALTLEKMQAPKPLKTYCDWSGSDWTRSLFVVSAMWS